MPLSIRWQPSGAYLIFKYRKNGKQVQKYIGVLHVHVSNTPILDAVLENMTRCNVDELRRIQATPKYWRPIRKNGTTAKQSGD